MHFASSLAAAALFRSVAGSVLPAPATTEAPLIIPRDGNLISDNYIIKLKNGYNITAGTMHVAAKPHFLFNRLRAFSASLSANELAKLREIPAIDYIEQDAAVTAFTVQDNSPWGLARLSSTKPGATNYMYDETAGAGTCAYIIDSGIDASHPDFEGRATFVANYVDNNNTDVNGHGTHVSGTIGSKTYGVAKKTTLYGVKVLDADGSGSNSAIIAGMEFVTSHAANNSACPNGTVVNMSLGGLRSAAVNAAAANLVEAGFFLAVAAGNGNDDNVPQDARTVSPASSPYACTVGATNSQDVAANFSNYGADVAIQAPGVDIESTWPGGGTKFLSGTSMASPHVAGLAAYFLGMGVANATNMCDFIVQYSLPGVITGLEGDTVNRLAQNGATSQALGGNALDQTSSALRTIGGQKGDRLGLAIAAFLTSALLFAL